MKRHIYKITAAVLISALAVTSMFPAGLTAYAAQPGSKAYQGEQIKTAKEDEILVKYKDDSKTEQTRQKIKDKLKLGKIEKQFEDKRLKMEVLSVNSQDADKTINELKKDTNVLYAQPNYKLTIQEEPDYYRQWGLNNTGQIIEGVPGVSAASIRVELVWNVSKGAPEVIVGVLDTGVDIGHAELSGRIHTNLYEIPGNGIDDDGNGYIDDVNGWDFYHDDNTVYDSFTADSHGTMVSGIISANENNTGIMGISPDITLLPLKFIGPEGGYTSDAIRAISYAERMGVSIMNCSFGGPDDNRALKEAMEASGMLFVCAAGNNGADINEQPVYPAAFGLSNIIPVTSMDHTGNLAPDANYGLPLIAAPGKNIWTTVPGDSYSYGSGTSFAASFATGASALIKSISGELTGLQIKEKIVSGLSQLIELKDKVLGLLSAEGALVGPEPQTITEGAITTPGAVTGDSLVTPLSGISQALIDAIHFGEAGVNYATGNYSKTITGISLPSPGFLVNMSFTYNSKDNRTTSLMGRGWTFGFEGSLKQDTSDTTLYIAKLPDGSVQTFKLSGSTFTAEDSRSRLTDQGGGVRLLTTKDQYQYSFSSSGYLQWMEDRNGNRVTIEVNSSGKVSSITDAVGRAFTVGYDGFDHIISVTGPGGLSLQFTYTPGGLLKTATDPNGNRYSFEYDSSGFLTEFRDRECQTDGAFAGEYTEQISYNHTAGVDKVTSYTDSFGNTHSISYDTTNRITTVTDSNNRVIEKYYDATGYITKTIDPLDLQTTVSYHLTASVNKYGEEYQITDRNGNITAYNRDDRGNITKIIYPDNSESNYVYDSTNNLIKETDQEGKKRFYLYDANGNLVKEAVPVNGTDEYSEGGSQDPFAVRTYTYSDFGSAKKLLQSSTDANGNTTTYDYDAYGGLESMTDVNGHVTAYVCSVTGNLLRQTDPDGVITTFAYDKNGNLLRKSIAGKYATRYLYDKEDRLIREISPNEYRAELDGLQFSVPANTYVEPAAGKFTEYYKSGTVKKVTDNLGYETEYQYDLYGNKTTETRPNGAQYEFTYDGIHRPAGAAFKENASATAIPLDSYAYGMGANRNTVYTRYLSASDTSDAAITTTYYDKLDRETAIVSPEGHTRTITYYANGLVKSESDFNGNVTHYRYDGLNRKTFAYEPVENGLYSCAQTVYDRNGNILEERVSRSLVALDAVPPENETIKLSVNTYDNENNLIKTVTPAGGETTYEYNNTNECIKTSVLKNPLLEREDTAFAYNELSLVTRETATVKAKDIYGNDPQASGGFFITTYHTYDLNGNLIKTVRPGGYEAFYGYDALDRHVATTESAINENGVLVMKTAGTTYDEEGNVLTTTDALGNISYNEYDERGNLVKKYRNVTSEGIPVPIAYLYAYDNADRLVMEVSPKNFVTGAAIGTLNRTEYAYDRQGRLIETRSVYKKPGDSNFSEMVTKALTYDGIGNILTEKDALGVLNDYATVYAYNGRNRLVTVLTPEDADQYRPFSRKLVYDSLGRVISEIDGRGVVKNTYYNDASRITKISLKLSEEAEEKTVAQYEYDFAGNQTARIDGNGNRTLYEYTHTNQVSKETLPSDDTIGQLVTTYQYDAEGLLRKKETSAGQVQLWRYDPQGNLLSAYEANKDNGEGINIQTRYDLNGNAVTMTDGNGNVTSLVYDEASRLTGRSITTKSAGGISTVHTEQIIYDPSGNILEEIDWLENSTEYEYDALSRLIKRTGADGVVLEELEYNDNNAQTKSITYMDGDPLTIEFGYDKNNRLTERINNGIIIETLAYDGSGNVAVRTDGNGNTMAYYYDEANRLIRTVNPLSYETVYTYDPAGNLISQRNEKGDETLYEYNCRNLLKKRIDAGGRSGSAGFYTYDLKKVEAYTYYPNGLMKEKVDRNGIHTTYKYDIHGRLIETKAGSLTVSNTYDKNGNKLTMTDATGTTGRVYDALNRCIVKTVPNIGTTVFDYDVMTELGAYMEVTTDPRGNGSAKVYDELGRVIAVKDGETVKATYEYYENGLKKSVAYPQNAVTESYAYTPNGQLEELVNKRGSTVLYSYSYEYDNAGNQTSKTEAKDGGTGLVTQYQYDSLNRLLKVIEPGVTTEYTYDPAGNRLSEAKTEGGATRLLLHEYNEQNRLVATREDTGPSRLTTAYVYDNNGNLLYSKKEQLTLITDPQNIPKATFSMFIVGQTTEEENPFVAWMASYAYDEFNQMVKSATAGGTIESKYNGEGFRTEKTLNGGLTRFLYIEGQPVLEVDEYGRETARNILGTNLVSRIVDGASELYYLYNGHGDVTELITPQGTIAAEYTYDAFGVPKTTTGTADNPFRYAGYQYDESGLYYLQSRMYNPVIARFMQEDTYQGQPNDPLSLNLYAYCNNNPLIYYDPDGHVVTAWDKKNLNRAQQAALGIQTRLYDTAKAKGDTTGMAAAHTAAEAIRNTARSSSETGSASGYTYKVNSDGSASLNKYDSAALDKSESGGGSTLNGSSYIPERYGSAGEIIIQNFNSMMPALMPMKSTNIVQGQSINNNNLYGSSTNTSILYGANPYRNGTIYVSPQSFQENLNKLAKDFINAYKAHQTSGNLWYDEINYWTMGSLDAWNRNWNSEPLSLENWVASAQFLLYCIPESRVGVEGNALRKELASIIDDAVKRVSIVDDFISNNVPKQFQTQVKNAFSSDIKVTTLKQDKTVYRYYGGDSAPSSYWVTPTKVNSPISELALPPGNTAQYVDSIVLKKGTTVLEGTVAPNFGQPGGGYQYFVPSMK